jgi:hypothetical protein
MRNTERPVFAPVDPFATTGVSVAHLETTT